MGRKTSFADDEVLWAFVHAFRRLPQPVAFPTLRLLKRTMHVRPLSLLLVAALASGSSVLRGAVDLAYDTREGLAVTHPMHTKWEQVRNLQNLFWVCVGYTR